jgi:uncharacterized protein (UPF0332 family)
MSFDWSGYIEIADSLLTAEGDPQARYRASISRAYYAVMHFAKARLSGFPGMQDNMHNRLVNEYRARKHPNDVKIYKILRKLLDERVNADYNSDYIFIEDNVTVWVKEASSIVNFMKSERR